MGLIKKILKNEDEMGQKDDVSLEKKTVKTVVKNKPKTSTKKNTSKDDTKNAYKVLVRPIISEKATIATAMNKYVFMVNEKTNKSEVKKAISAVYGIMPIAVNILKVKGKNVRFGKTTGKRKDWKKAVVTLPKGKTIQLYDGI